MVLIALPFGVFADRLPGLELIAPTQGMCLLNVYLVVKVLEESFPGQWFLTPQVLEHEKGKIIHFERNF